MAKNNSYNEGSQESGKIKKAILALNKEIEAYESRIFQLTERQHKILLELKKDKKELVAANKNLNKSLENQNEIYEDMGKQLSGKILKSVELLSDKLSKIPLIGNSLVKFLGLSEERLERISKVAQHTFVKSMKNGDGLVKSMNKSLGVTGKFLGKGGLIAIGLISIVALATALVKGFLQLDNTAGEFAKKIGIGKTAAKELLISSNKIGLTWHQAEEAVASLSSNLATMNITNEDIVKGTADLAYYYGISNEEASKLIKLGKIYGKDSEQTQLEIMGTLTAFENMGVEGLSFQKTVSAINNLSSGTRALFKGNLSELTKAVVQADMLGASVDQLSNASRNLLNIETSLSDQYNLQVLTGRQFNLDKIRAEKLLGDPNEANRLLGEEITKNADLLEDNVVFQESFAKAMGMSVDEIATMVENQRLQKVLGQDITEMSIKDLNAQIAKQKALGGQNAESAIAALEAQKNVTLTEEWNHTIDKMKETFLSFLSPKVLVPTMAILTIAFGYLLKKAIRFSKALGSAVTKMSTLAVESNLVNLNGRGDTGFDPTDLIPGKKGKPKGIGRIFKAFSKGGLKGGGKAITRMLSGGLKGGGKAITSMLSGAGKGIATGAKGVLGKVAAPLELIMGGITGFTQTSGKSAEEKEAAGIKKSMGAVEGTIQGVLTGGAEKGSMFSDTLGIEKGSAGDEAMGILGAAGRGAATGAAIGSIIPGVGTAIGGVVGGIVGTVSEGFKVFSDPNSKLRKGIVDFADEASTKISGWASSAKETLGGWASSAGDSISDFYQGHINLAKKAGSWISSIFSDEEESVPNSVPKPMARGGVVMSATNAIVGEAGPEAVVPLDAFYAKIDELIKAVAGGGMGAGTQPVTLHVHFDDGTVQKIGNRNTYLQRNGSGLGIRKV